VRVPVEGLVPEWPAPASIRAFSSFRGGGVSAGPWRSLNLGDHVGDDPAAVTANRRRLRVAAQLPGEPHWLEQVHGCEVVFDPKARCPRADGVATDQPGRICPVMTADCLPVLLCNQTGTRVAAAHAGWRGLAAGVLESALARFCDRPERILAWLGPAIGPEYFEVGENVLTACLRDDAGAAACFHAKRPGHWLADLYGLARRRLGRYGVTAVYGGDWCTYADAARFFSHRRDGVTGRMATLIWIDPGNAR
jgi:YfiH family protein